MNFVAQAKYFGGAREPLLFHLVRHFYRGVQDANRYADGVCPVSRRKKREKNVALWNPSRSATS